MGNYFKYLSKHLSCVYSNNNIIDKSTHFVKLRLFLLIKNFLPYIFKYSLKVIYLVTERPLFHNQCNCLLCNWDLLLYFIGSIYLLFWVIEKKKESSFQSLHENY